MALRHASQFRLRVREIDLRQIHRRLAVIAAGQVRAAGRVDVVRFRFLARAAGQAAVGFGR